MRRTKSDLESFHADKAVKDNIIESWLCVDCGINTAPGIPSAAEIRIAFKLGAKTVEQHVDNNSEIYDVKHAVWQRAGMRGWNGCLCIGCLELRLGRQLRPKDFTKHDRECYARLPGTDRLLDRRGFRGPRAMSKTIYVEGRDVY